MKKDIVIYPHSVFNTNDGGVTVQYYLANILDKLGINVKICNKYDNNSTNSIFNKFIFEKDIDIENTIVIYCEGIIGNPVKAKYVVRWMLSKLGQNVPIDYYFSWGKNELVYFFNSETNLINNNVDFKQLSVFYLDKGIQNLNNKRNETCYTERKSKIHNNIKKIHPDNSYEITRKHSQEEIIEIFNNHDKFISYDPLTFLTLIAPMCGCISIIYPIEGISKKDYLKMTSINDYLIEKNVDLYGVAYGINDDELLFAKNTLDLSKKQIEDIQQWFIDKYVINFIKDVDNFENNKNTLSFYKYIMILKSTEEGKLSTEKQVNDFVEDVNFDIEYYSDNNPDLYDMSYLELIYHYKNHGKKEGRVCSKKINDSVDELDFDVEYYRNIYEDLKHFSCDELIHHYKNHGEKEGRFCSKKKINDFVDVPDFDVKYYRNLYEDLKHFSYHELIHHYKNHGKKEGRVCSKKKINDFVNEPYFDVEYYRNIYEDLKHFSCDELIHHYKNHGEKEGRFCSKKQVNDFVDVPDFDVKYYRNLYEDLKHFSYHELIHHYKNHGKKEQRFGSEKQMKDFVDDQYFDVIYYRNIHEHLKNISYHELIHHYKNHGKKEERFGSEKQMKDFVDDQYFDVIYYRNIYEDLINMSYYELIHHYKNHGKKEGRFGSEKQIRYFVDDQYFDVIYYRNIHEDLKNISYHELIYHYKNHGKKEQRFGSEKQMKDFVDDQYFDVEFYKKYNQDLNNLTFYELIHHYKSVGKKEKRVSSSKYAVNLNQNLFICFFYDNYKNFDINFYKAFNTDIFFNNDIDYLYYHHNDIVKKRFTSLDNLTYFYSPELYQSLNLDLKYIDNNHILHEEIEYIKSSIISRRCYTKQIDDIEFSEIFYDFDIDYYKNNNDDLLNYLKTNNINNEITNIFLKQHFYNFGRFERRLYNNKIKIIIVSDLFKDSGNASGGAIACYYLAYLINNLNLNFYAKMLTYSNSIIKNKFCNDLATIGEINNNSILIYPDGSAGNPFSGKYVIRWMLQELGNFRPKDFFKFWSKGDFVYHWENLSNVKNIKILVTPYMNEKFKIDKNSHFKREGSCYLIKKYKYNNNTSNLDFHENESILIDNLSTDEIMRIFQTKKNFYCYDINSYYWLAALLSGCKSIVYPLKYTKEEWYSKTCFNYTNILYDKIAYGKEDVKNTTDFTEYEIENFLKCVNENTNKNLLSFLDDIYNIIVNKNTEDIPTVEDIYYK
jgi:hypothetical protein